jgi:nucleoside-diphosphate-sugar epimerase
MMRILIAGGAGYVGSALIPRLLERGYLVDVVDLFWFGNSLPGETGLLDKDIFEVTTEDLKPYDQVLFLAGLSNDPMAEFSPSKNFVYNAAAPAYLAYTAKKAGVKRYVYASSCSVYGYTVNEVYDESRPAVSSYPYGMSKLQGEQAVMNLVDDHFSVVALRKGTICGYSPRMRLDLMVNTMFRTAMHEGVIRIDNPSIWRPILAMEDAITAYIRAIEAHESISGIFNIASGNYTVGDVGDLVKAEIESLLGVRVGLRIRHVQDFRNYKVSFEKAKDLLSFNPQHDVRAIVRQLVAERSKFSDWENPSYYNIRVFRALENGIGSHTLGQVLAIAQ